MNDKKKKSPQRFIKVAIVVFILCFSTLFPIYFQQEPIKADLFGYQGDGSASASIENVIRGSPFVCPSSGTADNLTIRLVVNTASHKVKGAIYVNSTKALVSNGVTEEKIIPVQGATGTVFNFTGTKPSLVGSTEYLLIVWGNSTDGDVLVRVDTTGGYAWQDNEAYNGFPNPTVHTNHQAWNVSIYCSYTVSGWSNTAPTNTDFRANGSVNGSTGICLYSRLNISTVDADGNNSNIYWETNASGSWGFIYQTNTSCLNATYYDVNFSNASAYSTTYWIRISINDTHDNTTRVYHFTTESAPSGDTSYYVSNSGKDSNDGLSPANPWENISKVNTELSGVINVGDNIYFNRGDTFDDADLAIRLGGITSNWMIIGNYGTGSRPIIDNHKIECAVSSIGYIKIQDLEITNFTGTAITFAQDDINDIHIYNCYINNISGNNGIYFDQIDTYKIENCDLHTIGTGGIVIYGDSAGVYDITNGTIRNCTMGNIGTDGITLHVSGGAMHGIGPNHAIINCTGHGCGEEAFDFACGDTTERNIMIKDCEGYNNSQGTIMAKGIENFTIDNVYSHDEPDDGIILIAGIKNVIVRNCVITNSTSHSLYIYGASGDITENITIYNNDIIGNGTAYAIQTSDAGPYNKNLFFKNNIIYSTKDDVPGYFLRQITGNLSTDQINYTNNIWWRGDGGAGDDTWWYLGGDLTQYNLSEWQSFSETTGELRDNASMSNPTGNNFPSDFELNADSPCINAGDWLTKTSGTGTTTQWVTVDEANYFFVGLSHANINGDNIFVGTDTNLEIIEINYANESFKVNRSITWADNENVSLSDYNDSIVDIGAREYPSTSNVAPSITNEQPSDGATGQSLNPTLQVDLSDSEGDTMNLTFRTNATGGWTTIGWHNSTGNGTKSNTTSVFTNWGTKYYWSANATDGTDWNNESYDFTTTVNNSPIISSPYPTNGSTGIALQPLCNVTVTDTDGDSMNVYFYNGTDGVNWTLNQTNSSVASGTNVTWNYTMADTNGTLYYWKIAANDSLNNASVWYSFTTTSANTAPNATNDVYNVEEAGILTIDNTSGILANDNDTDGDNLTAILVSDVSQGDLTLNSDGSFTYKAPVDFSGLVTFTYYANDGTENSTLATVYLYITQASGTPWDNTILCYQRIWTKDDKGQVVIVYSGGRIKRITGYDSIIVIGMDDVKKFEGLLFL